MLHDLQICIPSRSRFRENRTLHNLSKNLLPIVTVVVPVSQYEDYRSRLPEVVKILPFEGQGIAAKREFILTSKRNGKLIMLDDDLRFHKRTQDGTKFPATLPEQTEQMFEEMSKFLDLYPMVGLTDKFMSHTKPRFFIECHRFNQVLGINRDLLPQPWPQFRVRHDEEHDVHLQLLTRGCKTAVLTEWSKSDKAGAAGGCNDWRSPEILKQVHEELTALWPTIVSITPDPPRARYNWKEAKRIGGLQS